MVSSLSSVLPTSQVFTSGYVNMETILHFFYKITNERGTKTVFTYAHVKWFYGQSERTYYLNYFINVFVWFSNVCLKNDWISSVIFSFGLMILNLSTNKSKVRANYILYSCYKILSKKCYKKIKFCCELLITAKGVIFFCRTMCYGWWNSHQIPILFKSCF